jgi:hypothetical protein
MESIKKEFTKEVCMNFAVRTSATTQQASTLNGMMNIVSNNHTAKTLVEATKVIYEYLNS